MIKVLIVDDEYIMRQGLKYMFNWEQEGYEIVGEATNGAEALKLLEELKPHIIICDIVMPLLNGVDFAEAVHKMHPQIQTIIGFSHYPYWYKLMGQDTELEDLQENLTTMSKRYQKPVMIVEVGGPEREEQEWILPGHRFVCCFLLKANSMGKVE